MEQRSRTGVTVVGGGVAGLIAAVELTEIGVPVRLLEARGHLGGRATSTPKPYVANLGPHALYTGTALWDWLARRDLHGPSHRPPSSRVTVRWQGQARRLPPRAMWPLVRLGRGEVPIDQDLRGWLTGRWGPDAAAAVAGACGALTFDHDPGRLSAAFVVERIRRILLHPRPTARYVEGGWSTLTARLGRHATDRGVDIQLGAQIDAGGLADLTDRGPVIVAVEPGAARRLLGDQVAPAPPRKAILLDVGLRRRRRDPYLVIDLDEAAFSTRASAVAPGLAPDGCELVQMGAGMRPDEKLDEAAARLEAVWDVAMDGWRDRVEWHRRAAVQDASGAVDLPGTTWRDRPAVAHAPDLWLAGDWVASPGHLAEVSCTSAVTAARSAATVALAVRGRASS